MGIIKSMPQGEYRGSDGLRADKLCAYCISFHVIVGASSAEALVHERMSSANPVDLAPAKVYERMSSANPVPSPAFRTSQAIKSRTIPVDYVSRDLIFSPAICR